MSRWAALLLAALVAVWNAKCFLPAPSARTLPEAPRLASSDAEASEIGSSFSPLTVGAAMGLMAAAVGSRQVMSRSRAGVARAADKNDGSVRQLLGMKGAGDEEVPLWKIRLQLCKPVTWPPLVLGCVSGASASGNFTWETQNFVLLFIAMFISGPCLTGFTQTINDWYDREIDAINEPYRPIPSGRITESQVWEQIWALLITGLSLALGLDYYVGHIPSGPPTVFLVALVGVFLAYIYSAPPLKLKVNGWTGGYALGWSYVSLPWLCGQALFGTLSLEVFLLVTFYSIAGIGISIVNDFKSIEGDRKLGLDSIPVMYGVDTSKYLVCGLIDTVQLCVAAYLVSINETNYALGLLALMVPQLLAQKVFLEDPIGGDVKFQASSLPFFQFGIIVAASAIGDSPFH